MTHVCAWETCTNLVPPKDPTKPGPQAIFCSQRCRHRSGNQTTRQRRRENAEAAAVLATYLSIDWARVPASVLADAQLRAGQT